MVKTNYLPKELCRKEMNDELRNSIFVRANGLCEICHKQPPTCIHHAIPYALTHEHIYLVAICEECHKKQHLYPHFEHYEGEPVPCMGCTGWASYIYLDQYWICEWCKQRIDTVNKDYQNYNKNEEKN